MYPERHEIMLTFRRYDCDKDELLQFDDLVRMIGPRDQRYRDLMVARKSFNEGRCFMRARCFLPETMQDF